MYIPDGFVFCDDTKTLHVYEVNGHSYTNPARITRLVNLWWAVDACSWFLNLTTVNLFTGLAASLTISRLSIWRTAEVLRHRGGRRPSAGTDS